VKNVCVSLFLVALCAGRASGDEGADVERARQLSDAGLAAFNQGRYSDAVAAFDAAYALSKAPLLLYNSAQAHRLKGDCAEALALYRRYLDADAQTTTRAIVEAHIANMTECVRAHATRVVLLPTPPPPLVKRPWLWITIAGAAAVAATVIGIGVVYGARDPVPSSGAFTVH
jgi:tetratricopeptide (TPR) repeat protein